MYKNGQKCPICATGSLEKKIIQEKFEYNGRHLVISEYVVFSCTSCGEELVSKETLRNTERIIRDFQRESDGLLTSEKIKKGRTALGFTQESFASLLGVGEKNFARYENGKVTQSKSMDNLLRIIFEYPFTLDAISDHKFTFDNVQSISYSTKASDSNIVYDFAAMKRMRA